MEEAEVLKMLTEVTNRIDIGASGLRRVHPQEESSALSDVCAILNCSTRTQTRQATPPPEVSRVPGDQQETSPSRQDQSGCWRFTAA